ncbi:MAG: translesion error-prone DNA polymerase V autoproteolytic subunit [Alphaproteobacteria bacterium]
MQPQLLPLYGSVAAGFPSPADDFLEGYLDLNAYLVKHPAATYFVRAKADAMQGAGIFKGDLMVVDKSLTPAVGSVVIAVVAGEMFVRRLVKVNGQWALQGEQGKPPKVLGDELVVWGVVSNVIHKV